MEPSNRPQPNRGSPLVQFLPIFVALLLCAPQLAGAATNSFPTLNAIGNRTINEDAGLQTVNLSGITTGSTNDVDTLSGIHSFLIKAYYAVGKKDEALKHKEWFDKRPRQ